MGIRNDAWDSFKPFVLVVVLLVFAVPSQAQTKEVELEVVGPWTYAPDPGNSHRIFLIAPIAADHKVDVFSGGDAYQYKQDATPGSYSLEFDTATCSKTQSILSADFLKFAVDPGLISDLVSVSGKGKRYAISVPKPCYFETYLDARAILLQQQISPPQGEAHYVIWMKLHYTVQAGLAAVAFTGKSDNGLSSPVGPSITFAPSAKPPKAEAISIVLYDASDVEDYNCDSYSAQFFDAVTMLWGQQGWHRLFPELDGNHNQAEPYNTTCSQQLTSRSAVVSGHGAMKTAKNKHGLSSLQQHKRTAGRTDCHSTQVSLNGTVQ